MIKLLNILVYTVFVAFLVGIAGLLIGSMLPIPGNVQIKIVKSGSMEPAIPTGALVVVKPDTRYFAGDVITFGADTRTQIPTTHRITEVHQENGRASYTTKGDANEEADPNAVLSSEVIGKVVLSVPYAGFVLDFARQPLGFALLIGVPAALVILQESMTIFREVRATVRRRRDDDDEGEAPNGPNDMSRAAKTAKHLVYLRRRAMDEIFVPIFVEPRMSRRSAQAARVHHADAYGTATALVLGLIFVSSMLAGGAGGTIAYFSDIERSVGNIFRAGAGWEKEEAETSDDENLSISALTFVEFEQSFEEILEEGPQKDLPEKPEEDDNLQPVHSEETQIEEENKEEPESPEGEPGQDESDPDTDRETPDNTEDDDTQDTPAQPAGAGEEDV